MKKAKEHAKIFNDSININDEESIEKAMKILITDLLKEGSELIKQRNAKRDSAIIAIFIELNQKYNSVVSMTEGILRRDGFKAFLQKQLNIKF